MALLHLQKELNQIVDCGIGRMAPTTTTSYHQLPPGTTRVIYEFPLCGKVTGSHLTAIGCLRAPTPLRQVLTVKNCTR